MSLAVIDASAAVRIFVPTPQSPAIRAASQSHVLVSPWLILAETANAFWKYVRAGEMTADEAQGAMAAVPNLTNIVADDQSGRALTLAARLDHPVYDCFYLALAEQRGAPLLTANRRLRKHAETIGVSVLPLDKATGEDPPS